MEALQHYSLTEQQFAHLIGLCKMYQHLPSALKEGIPDLCLGEAQINSLCRDYYKDGSFSRAEGGNISLWKLYNLFTAANKASYIDSILDRAVSVASFAHQLANALGGEQTNWFLS
jgi:hypothetical protein